MLNIAEIIAQKYNVLEARDKVASLSQGERDVLEQVRGTLGWPTILSLAFKYYPAFPNRKWWLEALRRANKWAKRRNIVYLLKALRSIQEEHLQLAFSGKAALNRLVYPSKYSRDKDTNRLEPEAREASGKPDKYIIMKYGHLIRKGGAPA